MTKKNGPIHAIQLGSVRGSVWETPSDEGKTFHNVTMVRCYKDKNGDWQESSTFNGLADLALVKEVARLAANFIEQRERELEAND